MSFQKTSGHPVTLFYKQLSTLSLLMLKPIYNINTLRLVTTSISCYLP